jgi:GNAT superfamily N-acetyltransferase
LTKGYGYVDDETPELTMAVLPFARGQGIGTELLTRLMELARSHYSGISLSVWPENSAYRLYQRLGFQVVKTNDEEDVIMLKRFAPLGQ